jgi:Tfp pilus assembly PilM family ATPase
MALLNPLSNAFGLDLGDRTFKAVQVTEASGKSFRLKAWGSVAVDEGVMDKGEILDIEKAASFMRQLRSKTHGKIHGQAVVASLPEAKSFVKVIEVDRRIASDKLRAEVVKEIQTSIPIPLEDIYFDWQVLEQVERPAAPPEPEMSEPQPAQTGVEATEAAAAEPKAEPEGAPPEGVKTQPEAAAAEPKAEPKNDETQRLILAAAPKKLVDEYTKMLEIAGFAPIAFEIESMAISRALVPENEKFDESLGILDIGATRSSLIIIDEGAIQMSISIPLSGNEITKAIAEKLNVSEADAELIKIECGLDARRCEDKMWKILLPLIDDMSSKIRNALRFFKIGFPLGKKIERIWLCGGGAHFRDIDSVLSRKLTIKARLGDALANIAKPPRAFLKESALSYATAIGLGMRASEESKHYRSAFHL